MLASTEGAAASTTGSTEDCRFLVDRLVGCCLEGCVRGSGRLPLLPPLPGVVGTAAVAFVIVAAVDALSWAGAEGLVPSALFVELIGGGVAEVSTVDAA